MSIAITAPVAPVLPVAPVTETVTEPIVETPLTVEQLQEKLTAATAHSRTWEKRATDNKAAVDELAALKLAGLTETERLKAELASAQELIASTSAESLRSKVALATGVKAEYLQGKTEEELTAFANQLLADFPAAVVKPPVNDAAASGALGAPIAAGAQITSKDQLKGMSAAEIVQAKKDGRLAGLLGS